MKNTSSLSEIKPGSTLPTWERETGFPTWNRFAAVNDEFVDIHMDDEAGREAGMSGAFGPGNMLVSYLHASLEQWLGAYGRILDVEVRFRAPNIKGLIRINGEVSEVSRGPRLETIAVVRLSVTDGNDSELAPATATVQIH